MKTTILIHPSVGDRVRINDPRRRDHGQEGVVTCRIEADYEYPYALINVTLDKFPEWKFTQTYESNIEYVEALDVMRQLRVAGK
jgi:hypothetical protein